MKDFIKTILINVLIATISSYIIIHFIQLHSVHPEYGNYKKVSLELNVRCSPWDSCP